MKRFWDSASVAPGEDGFAVLLDGRPLRLPGGAKLSIAAAPLAEAIAAEWQAAGGAKGGEMSFADTPLTRLAGTAQERIAANREANVHALAAYAETDLLCYRAEAPEPLVRRQAQHWQPWLDWAALTYDAPLKVTAGIVHVAQDRQALSALRAAVAGQNTLVLAGLGILVPQLGSLVLGLAVTERMLDAAEAYRLAILDELFQEEFWGADTEALRRREAVAADVAMAGRFITLAKGTSSP
jgi:chaperone required for assembly of F1-ATPase